MGKVTPEARRRYGRVQYNKHKEFLAAQKAVPCAECGGVFPPCAMDFDHVRGKKKFHLAYAYNKSRALVFAEIAKCEIVCANCHRIRTFILRKKGK